MRYFFLVLLCLISASAASAKDTQNFFHPFKLERVIDGDTLVASGQTIRLWGINAPEKNAPLYRVSTMYLETILAEGGLACKMIELDRYRRSVMHCTVHDADIGSMMVQMGMAKDFTKYSGGYYQEEEREARARKRGIWAQPTKAK